MAKISRIDPSEIATVADLTHEPVEPKILKFDLARNRGVAEFREPTAADLSRVELAIGNLGISMADGMKMNFCRQLARTCCISWGAESEMPAPEKIRSADDEGAIRLFAEQLGGGNQNADEFCRLLEGESSRGDGFDAYAVTLTGGEILVFDEPTQLDNQKRQKGKTSTDGTLQFAAALCRDWDGASIKWSESLSRLQALSLEDFFRVSLALTSFRG